MNRLLFLGLPLLAIACQAQKSEPNNTAQDLPATTDVEAYAQQFTDDGKPSQFTGTPGNGTLINGKLMPFSGPNFQYFDALSYCNGRAFVHSAIRDATLAAYKQLHSEVPGRMFGLMECAHQHGGKLRPHRTHQNGLSIDFMMPLVKDGEPYYKLDKTGLGHYLLDFDNAGRFHRDKSIGIDFDLVARHILALDAAARAQGFKVSKVIIKIELKDELFATKHGKLLKNSSIYVVQSLTPKVNALHDEHFHIDFAPLD